MRPRLPIDDHVTFIGEGETRKVSCNYCAGLLNRKSIPRWESHIRNCKKSPASAKKLFPVKRQSTTVTIIRKSKVKDNIDESDSSQNQTGPQDQLSDSPGPAPPAAKRARGRTLNAWTDTMTSSEKDVLDRAYADIFYTSGIPFRVAENPCLINFLKMLRPAYKPPSSKRIAGPLLKEAYDAEVERIKEKIEECAKISIVSDGWSNCRNNHLVNFIVDIPGKESFFITAVDVGEERQTALNIAKTIEREVILKFGVQKIASIVTDNCSVMQAAWKLLEEWYPSIICNGCAAHTLNLLMKDVAQLEEIEDCIEKCRKITKFVKHRSAVITRFRRIQTEMMADGDLTNKLQLELPVVTRFGTYANCCSRVMINKEVLEALSTHTVVTRINDGNSKKARIEFQKLVADEQFWESLKNVLEILNPIADGILEMETRKSDLSQVYQVFQRLLAKFEGNDEITSLVNERWAFIHTQSMGIAYFLNPKTKAGSNMVGTDKQDTIDQLEEFILEKAKISDDEEAVSKEIDDFVDLVTNPSDKAKRTIDRKTIATFWNIYDDRFPILKKVADIVFKVPTSQAASERIWSFYDFIHSKRRNKLTTEKVTMLVFIYANRITKDLQYDIVDILSGIDLEDEDDEEDVEILDT